MARAAVKAKQQQARVQAAPAKPARKQRRGHASGGNPNEQLFFMRLRRRQKWVFLALAVIFALAFVGVGVGSGNGGSLSQLWTGLFGGSSDSVSKAQAEIKTNPAKGWKDLANAYVTQGDTASAIIAFQNYLVLKKSDAGTWAQLAGLEQQQAGTYATQYQAAQAAAQAQAPGLAFQPGGPLGQQLGTSPVDQYYSQQSAGQTSQLYQKATSTYASALTDFEKAAKLQPRNSTFQYQIAVAATNIGQFPVAIKAWQTFLKLNPHYPQRLQVEATIKRLRQASLSQPSAPSTPPAHPKPKK